LITRECPYCSADMPAVERICPACGVDLATGKGRDEHAPHTSRPMETPAEDSPSVRRIVLWVVAGVAVLLLPALVQVGRSPRPSEPRVSMPNSDRTPIQNTRTSRVEPGQIKVDRVWKDAGYLYALVSYANDTPNTFSMVTIQCVAQAADGSKLGVNSRSWFEYRSGPITPGFEGVKEVPVNLHGTDGETMSCNVAARP